MKGTILITDSLFIFPEHEKMLRAAGYEIERLDKPEASEEELVAAVEGRVGYILGGIEHVTEKVIAAASALKAIVFTGSDWRHFIPGNEAATARGIAIANAPGANSYAVAEYTLTLMLAMVRNILTLGKTGDKKFMTSLSLREATVGIIGAGHIGKMLASMLKGLGVKEILYYSRQQHTDVEKESGATFVSLNELLERSDIVTIHVPKSAGNGFIGAEEMKRMKDGTILINCAFAGAIEAEALYAELSAGRLRAAQDEPVDERFNALPLSVWFNSNSGTAFNTSEANTKASDMATQSILNLLEKGEDQYKVN